MKEMDETSVKTEQPRSGQSSFLERLLDEIEKTHRPDGSPDVGTETRPVTRPRLYSYD